MTPHGSWDSASKISHHRDVSSSLWSSPNYSLPCRPNCWTSSEDQQDTASHSNTLLYFLNTTVTKLMLIDFHRRTFLLANLRSYEPRTSPLRHHWMAGKRSLFCESIKRPLFYLVVSQNQHIHTYQRKQYKTIQPKSHPTPLERSTTSLPKTLKHFFWAPQNH